MARLVQLTFLLRLVAVLLTLGQLVAVGARAPSLVAALLGAGALSFAGLRWWERLAPVLERHPSVVAVDVALSCTVLVVAGPTSPFVHYTLATAMVAGTVHGPLGAGAASALLWAGHGLACRRWQDHVDASFLVLVGLPSLYPVAAFGAAALARAFEVQAAQGRVQEEAGREAARAEERARLARDLHDSVTKTVLGLSLQAGALHRRLQRDGHPLAAPAGVLAAASTTAATEARQVLHALRGRSSTDTLAALLDALVDDARSDGLDVDGQAHPDLDLDGAERRFELARIVQEALRNAAAHAPGSRVVLRTDRAGDGSVVVVVADDGPGFDPARPVRAHRAGRYGLVGMGERASALGGAVAVDSTPGRGTTVTVVVPSAPHPPMPSTSVIGTARTTRSLAPEAVAS